MSRFIHGMNFVSCLFFIGCAERSQRKKIFNFFPTLKAGGRDKIFRRNLYTNDSSKILKKKSGFFFARTIARQRGIVEGSPCVARRRGERNFTSSSVSRAGSLFATSVKKTKRNKEMKEQRNKFSYMFSCA
jgi:hypothetical protein